MDAQKTQSKHWAWNAAATIMWGQALLWLIWLGAIAWALFQGDVAQPGEAIAQLVVDICVVGGLSLLGFLLFQSRSVARTPSLLWNGIMIPIGVSFAFGSDLWVGVGLLLAGVVGVVVLLILPAYSLPEDD